MKNTPRLKTKHQRKDELRREYDFDYSKAKPNRFAGGTHSTAVAVLLDADVAGFFKDAESINTILRALMTAMPRGGVGQVPNRR
jgi:hypothetical protein